MKKLIIGLTLLLLPFSAFCQKYIPFNFKYGEWVSDYQTWAGVFDKYGIKYINERVKFYCNGDTVINDTMYNKLYYTGYSKPNGLDRIKISGFVGGIRNDTANKRVWLYSTNSSFHYINPSILFDFNLNIGDRYCYNYSDTVTINSIDSVLYCGVYHKRFNYIISYQNDPEYVIEGIGSTEGLIPVECCGFAPLSSLMCYSEKNSSACDSCATPAVAILKVQKQEITIFPNPANAIINISSELPLLSIEVFDIYGRLIYSNLNIKENEMKVELNNEGTYLLKVRTSDGSSVRKIIIN